MRKTFLLPLVLLTLGSATPAVAIDVDLSINAPGVSLYIGDRDRSGRYWDGGRWRDEAWWRDNWAQGLPRPLRPAGSRRP